VRLSEKKKDRIDAFLREVNQRIKRVPSIPETEVRQVAWGTGKQAL
jgi:U3 small nucleolar RNA-associated protein 22